MAGLRESIAAFLFLTFVAMPVWSAPRTAFGTVLLARRFGLKILARLTHRAGNPQRS